MKKKIGIAVIFCFALTSYAGSELSAENKTVVGKVSRAVTEVEEGIHFFKGTWQEALEKSKVENKLIFLDAYASWCGPCKQMAKSTFTNAAVGEFFNANFINVKMDMEKDPEGPRLSNAYKLTAYPTLYFVQSNEKVFHQDLGYFHAKAFLKLGNEVIEKKAGKR